MAACVFCALAAATPSAAVLEDDDHFAFLDHRPVFPGHCLLVPRRHVRLFAELPEEGVGPLFRAVRLLSRAVEEAMGAEGTFIAVNNGVSQSVPHLHVHVVPRRKGDGLRGFFWPRQKYGSAGEMEEVRRRVQAACARLLGRPPA